MIVLLTACLFFSTVARGFHLSWSLPRFRCNNLKHSMSLADFQRSQQPLTALHVRGSVKEGCLEAFYKATLNNARNSILEDGVVRFDLLRSIGDVNQFLLVEVYKDAGDHAKHRLTKHYNDWRPSVEPYMAAERTVTKYETLYPPVNAWTKSESCSAEDTSFYDQHRPWSAQPFSSASSEPLITSGGLLAHFIDAHVLSEKAAEFASLTRKFCAASVRESGLHRIDLLRSTDTPDSSSTTKFRLVKIFGSVFAEESHKQTAHFNLWAAAVAPLLAAEMSTESYSTLFPSPLYFHKPSALLYAGEGQDLASEQSGEEASQQAWTGQRGLGSTNLAAGAFGFQGPKILMGRGIAASAVRGLLSSLKLRRPLIVTGSSGLGRFQSVFEEVFATTDGSPPFDYPAHSVAIDGEPTVEDAERFAVFAISRGCDSVLSVGGGSALDAGKAVAALIPNSHRSIYDFLEVIGKDLPLEYDPLPFIAVPTTSGTGSEATKNAVLKSRQHGLKVSIRHEKMFPVAAVLDPMLTLSCPPSVTAHVGLDTLCQVLEPFLCCTPNPFVDALAKEGILRASRSLRDAVADGAHNVEAREDLAVASVMGGLSLANAKLGAVHGFAAVLGGKFENAAHGAICAALLPFVFEKNAECLQERVRAAADGTTDREALVRLSRFQEVSRLMTGNPAADIPEGARWLHSLVRDVNIPPLGVLCPDLRAMVYEGVPAGTAVVPAERALGNAALQGIVTATMGASSTKGNPVVLTREQLTEILLKAL